MKRGECVLFNLKPQFFPKQHKNSCFNIAELQVLSNFPSSVYPLSIIRQYVYPSDPLVQLQKELFEASDCPRLPIWVVNESDVCEL